jgi:hypothetical protein
MRQMPLGEAFPQFRLSPVQKKKTPQNIFGRAERQERHIVSDDGIVRHANATPEAEKNSSLFQRIQLPLRDVVPKRHLVGPDRFAVSRKYPGKDLGLAKLPHRSKPAKAAHDDFARPLLQKDNRIQLPDFAEGIQHCGRVKLFADPEHFIFSINFFE